MLLLSLFVNNKIVVSKILGSEQNCFVWEAGSRCKRSTHTYADQPSLALGMAKHLVHGALLEGVATLAVELV